MRPIIIKFSMVSVEQIAEIYRISEEDIGTMTTPEGYLASVKEQNFGTPFGRDAEIDSLFTFEFLDSHPERLDFLEPVKNSLITMALYQGKTPDDWRDERPGGIFHELRMDKDPNNVVNQNWLRNLQKAGWPVDEDENGILTMRYYGSVDSTPLFIYIASEYLLRTEDAELFKFLNPHIRGALFWVEKYGDPDGDGYIDPLPLNRNALNNQNWKDSKDSILNSDGQKPKEPHAHVEVQGYLYTAYLKAAKLYENSDPTFAADLRKKARDLKENFNRDFWMEDEGYFAQALDGDKRQVVDITSNVGHLLMTGIIDEDKLPRVVNRLMRPDMLSSGGIRPLSLNSPNFSDVEPDAYHRGGGIWPHDNAIIYIGLKRSGFLKEAGILRDSILEALYILRRDYNLHDMELFMVDINDRIKSYVNAQRPQSWAATAIRLLADPLEINRLRAV